MKIDLNKIRDASVLLSNATEKQRNLFLHTVARILQERRPAIIQANKKDVAKARIKEFPEAFIQRLVLDEKRVHALREKVLSVVSLPSGLGEIIEATSRERGLVVKKVRVPLGVLLVIYESRPEVTIDVAALCIKSGNAVILKGGSEAHYTNKLLYSCIQHALRKAKLKKESVSFVADRNSVKQLLQKNNDIDLVIARGGYSMVKAVQRMTKIPVLAHAAGGARIFVDKSADLSVAERVILNSKIEKPAACNSLDTVIVHRSIAKKFLPAIVSRLQSYGVSVSGDVHARSIVKVRAAKEQDWAIESLGPTVTVKVVQSIDEAIAFINLHGKRHSEGIIARDARSVAHFMRSVDAAALFANCSTRLHDGYVFGLGSEMGIATGKLHARGPVGLKELTTYKWEVYGKGQIRE